MHELAQERAQIQQGLAHRRTLLSSVQAQISQLEARQRALQARLAAEARARLAAQQAARARLEAEQKAAAQQAARERRVQELAQAKAQAAARQAAATTTAATTPAATTTDPSSPIPDPGPTTAPNAGPLPAGYPQAAQIALQYIGIPYLWGGATPAGFDCSGLVAYVFAQLGVILPHSAADQYGYGVDVPRADLQPGDLVFFDDLNHVGIYIGDNEIVNAPDTGSFVRIDSLSEPWYANRYVGARRV